MRVVWAVVEGGGGTVEVVGKRGEGGVLPSLSCSDISGRRVVVVVVKSASWL